MKKEDLIKIEEIIEKENLQSVGDCVSQNNKKLKNGIYFLYDENNNVIYVGKVGNGLRTSFYDRMHGHGSGALDKKSWFSEINTFRFKSFQGLNKKQLLQVKRLMLCAKQPKYNYCHTIENNIDAINIDAILKNIGE